MAKLTNRGQQIDVPTNVLILILSMMMIQSVAQTDHYGIRDALHPHPLGCSSGVMEVVVC